ncbi:MAG: ATP-grasp domain-containing protein, partial [Gammaproteobacteria bacterium]|nr:ATP-grasp domain-containing protein [Gammaproteobacteria bacterium]
MKKLLIANRGEIALRIQRTASAMGLRTVAVYSDPDADALHVRSADQAVPIGGASPAESYLDIGKLIAAARRSGADAVHPGYGFLSENAGFARACAGENITFVGPPAEAIELMGSKRLSKIAMLEAGVPCIPGYEGGDQSDATLLGEASRIGFPLMIKASAGGGGRGMRLVRSAAECAEQLKTARSEAQAAFGSSEVILERAVLRPRHIEIQVFADAHGNAIHLNERDCSIQRRHQKVVEEAPSPIVDEDLRRTMGAAAVKAALACSYRGAGTVEFLVDADRNFYFLEMNTRLQVEHPVTELVTGQDLVAWQIRVADGAPLPLTQEQVPLSGHAIEVRLYAEDPDQQFMPQTGRILRWRPAVSEGVRIDHGLREGRRVTPHYDPMLAKVIAHGEDREQARLRLLRAVEDTVLFGVTSNKHFLAEVLADPVFASGEANTAFLEEDFSGTPGGAGTAPPGWLSALAAALFYHESSRASTGLQDLRGWQSSAAAPWEYRLRTADQAIIVRVTVDAGQDTLRVLAQTDDGAVELDILEVTADTCTFVHDKLRDVVAWHRDGGMLYIDSGSATMVFEDITHDPAAAAGAQQTGQVVAPMDGVVVEVMVKQGDRVGKGQIVAVVEAMKMAHQLRAPGDGQVREVPATAGRQVRLRELLVD